MNKHFIKAKLVPMAVVTIGLAAVAGANVVGEQQRRVDLQKLDQQTGQTSVTAASELPGTTVTSSDQPAAEGRVGETKNESRTATTVEIVDGHATVTTSGLPTPKVTSNSTSGDTDINIDSSVGSGNSGNSWNVSQSTSVESARLRTGGSRSSSHSSVFSASSSYSEASD